MSKTYANYKHINLNSAFHSAWKLKCHLIILQSIKLPDTFSSGPCAHPQIRCNSHKQNKDSFVTAEILSTCVYKDKWGVLHIIYTSTIVQLLTPAVCPGTCTATVWRSERLLLVWESGAETDRWRTPPVHTDKQSLKESTKRTKGK